MTDLRAPEQVSLPRLGPRPLVVDVDGTLIKTDLLHESVLQLIATEPLALFSLPGWLAAGKAQLKARIAERVDLRTDTIPLREEVLSRIEMAKQRGQPVYLASASHDRYVAPLGARIGADGVFASTETVNLAGTAKAERLEAAFGPVGFDYVGDGEVDYPVWQAASGQLAVFHDARFEARTRRQFPALEVLARSRTRAKYYLKAMRPHQWAKNALIFLPLIAGHQFDVRSLLYAVLAFICFSCMASSAYIINDLLDLPGDRDHPRKRKRPFAAGDVPITHGIVLAAGLLVLAAIITLGARMPLGFAGALLTYGVATLAYSLVLKRYLLIDVIVLAGLYALRVLAGVAAIGAIKSPWLLMFCVFLFLSLAMVKRCSELIARQRSGKPPPLGRGYQFEDLRMLNPLAAAAGCGSILVIALYLASPEVRILYAHQQRMWLVTPIVLYWICRVLMISNRGELHDDPVVFAIRDPISWVCGLGVALVVLTSI